MLKFLQRAEAIYCLEVFNSNYGGPSLQSVDDSKISEEDKSVFTNRNKHRRDRYLNIRRNRSDTEIVENMYPYDKKPHGP